MATPKVLEILQLFTVEKPRWRVDRIAESMKVSSSTAYRCVAELVRAGFLQPVSGGAYVLGPAFSEFDLRMRRSDPLMRIAGPHLRDLRTAIGPSTTTVLARYYRDCVMFAHIARGRDVPMGAARGEKISLFSGAATARAVLFALPDRVLRNLYQSHAAEIAEAGLGKDAREFRTRIKALRDRGWVFARSMVIPGRVGIAAPVMTDGTVRGSMGVSVDESTPEAEIERIGHLVLREANRVGAALAHDAPDVPRMIGRRATAAPSPVPPAASAVQ